VRFVDLDAKRSWRVGQSSHKFRGEVRDGERGEKTLLAFCDAEGAHPRDAATFQPPAENRGQLPDAEVRPRLLGVVAQSAPPSGLRADPVKAPVNGDQAEGVLVQRAARGRFGELAVQVARSSLGHCDHGSWRAEVRPAESQTTLSTVLNHERLGIPVLMATTDVSDWPDAKIGNDHVD
jgi:hypothetical protein